VSPQLHERLVDLFNIGLLLKCLGVWIRVVDFDSAIDLYP